MKKQAIRRKPSTGGKAFLAIMTFLNLLLMLALALLRRTEVIHAVQGDGDVQVLITAAKAGQKGET